MPTEADVTNDIVHSALAEYDLALRSDPRNTEQLRSRPGVLESMRKDAMREALGAALRSKANEASN